MAHGETPISRGMVLLPCTYCTNPSATRKAPNPPAPALAAPHSAPPVPGLPGDSPASELSPMDPPSHGSGPGSEAHSFSHIDTAGPGGWKAPVNGRGFLRPITIWIGWIVWSLSSLSFLTPHTGRLPTSFPPSPVWKIATCTPCSRRRRKGTSGHPLQVSPVERSQKTSCATAL